MPLNGGNTAPQPNWLKNFTAPIEVKLTTLDYMENPLNLPKLARAHPKYVRGLWDQHPQALYPQAFRNAFSHIEPELKELVIKLYHIRTIRKEYIVSWGYYDHTGWYKKRLQVRLRKILSGDDTPELETKLDTILDIWEIIFDVLYLTDRYSSDAWRRIHSIARRSDQEDNLSTDPRDPPPITLNDDERRRFRRAFLRVDIYLLTNFWTNAKGKREMLNMYQHTARCIPHGSMKLAERQEFDSCLRYMFHAHRGFVKEVARQLCVSEVPPWDDFRRVPGQFDENGYLYKDHKRIIPQQEPRTDFARRSMSEEQRFLLWLCEHGIHRVRKAHENNADERKIELLQDFNKRHSWADIQLRHRFSRYDVYPDRTTSLNAPPYDPHRNRHPIKNLYGEGKHQGYTETSSPWACAVAFLDWTSIPGPAGSFGRMRREGLALGRIGDRRMRCDTDKEWGQYMAYSRKGAGMATTVPHGHQYILDPDKYELSPWNPWRIRTPGG